MKPTGVIPISPSRICRGEDEGGGGAWGEADLAGVGSGNDIGARVAGAADEGTIIGTADATWPTD